MQAEPARLFYDFRLDDHVPGDHLLRGIDRFLDLASIRAGLWCTNSGRRALVWRDLCV
jgi:hypothetical protein